MGVESTLSGKPGRRAIAGVASAHNRSLCLAGLTRGISRNSPPCSDTSGRYSVATSNPLVPPLLVLQRHVRQLSMAQVIIFQELKSFLRISIRTWLMDQKSL